MIYGEVKEGIGLPFSLSCQMEVPSETDPSLPVGLLSLYGFPFFMIEYTWYRSLFATTMYACVGFFPFFISR